MMESLPNGTAWVNSNGMLTEIRQLLKDRNCVSPLLCGINRELKSNWQELEEEETKS